MSWERTMRTMVAPKIGVGVGELYYVVAARASTDAYYSLLKARGVRDSKIFILPSDAYAATTASRNDVVLVYPGTYTETAKITWANSSTHMLGVGSRNQKIPADAGTTGNVFIISTVEDTSLLSVTGHHCQFMDFSIWLNAAAAVADIAVKGRNAYLGNIFMKSSKNATAIASAVLGYGLHCDGSAAGYCNGLTVEGCHIGDPRNTVRTAGGMIYMTGSGNAAMCYEFKDCVIAGWSATNACSAVFQTGNGALDRQCIWQDCTFYNFQENLGTILTGDVFADTCGTTHMNLLTGRTAQYGWDAWGGSTYTFGAMPIASVTGGTALDLT